MALARSRIVMKELECFSQDDINTQNTLTISSILDSLESIFDFDKKPNSDEQSIGDDLFLLKLRVLKIRNRTGSEFRALYSRPCFKRILAMKPFYLANSISISS